MIVDKETLKRMTNMASQNNEKITYENFSFYSTQCLIEEFMNIIEAHRCNVKDINMICEILPIMLQKRKMMFILLFSFQ